MKQFVITVTYKDGNKTRFLVQADRTVDAITNLADVIIENHSPGAHLNIVDGIEMIEIYS
jgi:hypothetical protein